jgi:hypothetical protein
MGVDMKLHNMPFYGFFYQSIMKIAHYFNWHYAPPCYPDGDTLLRCDWCGMSDVIKNAGDRHGIISGIGQAVKSCDPVPRNDKI